MTGLLGLDSSRGDSRDVRLGAPSLAALVRAVTAAAGSTSASDALRALAEAAQAVAGAEIALVRALDDGGERLGAGCGAGPPGRRGAGLRSGLAAGEAAGGAPPRPLPPPTPGRRH